MDILDNVKDIAEEKIEGMAENLTENMPEEIVDNAEDMINKATGADLDLNGNDATAESVAA